MFSKLTSADFLSFSRTIFVILAHLHFHFTKLYLPQLLLASMCSLLVVVVWCRCDFWSSVTRQSPLFLASCSLPCQSDLQHEGIPGCITCGTPNRTRNSQNTMALLTDCEALSACFIALLAHITTSNPTNLLSFFSNSQRQLIVPLPSSFWVSHS